MTTLVSVLCLVLLKFFEWCSVGYASDETASKPHERTPCMIFAAWMILLQLGLLWVIFKANFL
jgi:hypothetical protein